MALRCGALPHACPRPSRLMRGWYQAPRAQGEKSSQTGSRAATKAKRRQWDPPKKTKAPDDIPDDGLSRHSSTVDLNRISDSMLNGSLHFKDPWGAPTSVDEDSDFRRMDLGQRVQTETSERNAPPESMQPTPTPEERMVIEVLATMGQQIEGSEDSIVKMANLLSSHGAVYRDSIEYTSRPPTSVGPSSQVKSALSAVAKLNEGPLTVPTHIEQRRWVRTTFGFWGHFLQYRQFNTIDEWHSRVSDPEEESESN
ncbi:hypothetical protein B0H13DRAFT_1864545 [Mycena leptocephala]|nr:hypothetical protein B0H13DRAFT_1864545 [Mycena leptocephala]